MDIKAYTWDRYINIYLMDTLTIKEKVADQDYSATIHSRTLAWFIDRVLSLLIAIPILLLILSEGDIDQFYYVTPTKLGHAIGALIVEQQTYYSYELIGAVYDLWLCCYIIVGITRLYHIIIESRGSTLGKRLFNLKLVDASSSEGGFRVVLLNSLAFFIIHVILTIILGQFEIKIWHNILFTNILLLFPLLLNKRNRTLSEIISGTILIKKIHTVSAMSSINESYKAIDKLELYHVSQPTLDEIENIIKCNKSFKIFGATGKLLNYCKDVESVIESQGMTCRIYSKNRIGVTLILSWPTFGFSLVLHLLHMVLTYNPEWEIERDVVNNSIIVRRIN